MILGLKRALNMRIRLASLLVSLSPCLLVSLSAPAAADYEAIDSPMYGDPAVPAAAVEVVLPRGTKVLWVKALGRPESDLVCLAAEAITLARRRGVRGLESTVPALVAALDRPGQGPLARLAAAQALVALEARQAAPSLLRQARAGGADLRAVVEPALARWDYRPARAVWLDRLRDPTAAQGAAVLAIRALATTHEGRAAGPLRELVFSGEGDEAVRLEAASSLGSLGGTGLVRDAERLAARPAARATAGRLAAVALLRRQRGPDAVRLLLRLARDPEPPVAAGAAARLLDIDPKLALPLRDGLLKSRDARLRSVAVRLLLQVPTRERIGFLANRLDDTDPEVRAQARRALRELAGKGWRDRVTGEAMGALHAASWRGQEQAAVLLAQLGHRPAAGRLVGLLTHDRPEVFVAAAWGLRRLAVRETLPAVTRYVEGRQRDLRKAAGGGGRLFDLIGHQVSQLNQFLGRQRYAPADAVLQSFVQRMEGPKRPVAYPEARAAAIWALGLLHEGKPAPALVTAVEGRLNDVATLPPEDPRVRRMAAVALGQMKAKAALASLRKHYPDRKPSLDPVNNACGWAVQQVTGEIQPRPQTIRQVRRDWFLTPQD
jgi:HEAT repeat protein